VSYR
jgi:hypothetical protein